MKRTGSQFVPRRIRSKGQIINSSTHALKAGDRVIVYASAPSRFPSIEGHGAIVRANGLKANLYWVKFDGDPRPKLRVILQGDPQSEPSRFLAALRAYWVLALKQPELLTEFPPVKVRRVPRKRRW